MAPSSVKKTLCHGLAISSSVLFSQGIQKIEKTVSNLETQI